MKKSFIIIVLLMTPILAQCDWNEDGDVDVLDIVSTVDCIMNGCWDGTQCDWNEDGAIDVLDIVSTVDCIMTGCWVGEDIYGCTDPDATNFDPEATIDDGSCGYDRELTILYTNDEHGWMVRENGSGGGAELMGQWREVDGYTDDGPFLIISGGDNWTGPAISTWFQGESMVDMMNAMHYDASTIGNHEFDFGLDGLQSRLNQADYPFLSANMVLEDTGELSPLATAFVIKEVNNINVGIIGLTTTVADDINFPDNVENIDFSEYVGVLNEVVPQVLAQGAELLVVTSHICLNEMEALVPVLNELGIALIGGGHCHQPAAEMMDGVGIILGGSNMSSYAKAEIEFNTLYDVVNSIEVSTAYNQGLYMDEDVAAVVEYWQEQMDNELSQVIGYLDEQVGQSSNAMFNLITDAWLETYPADISMTNRGGIRQPMPAGEITFETWVGILPFENFIVEIELTGQELIDNIGYLVVGGMTTIPDYLLADGTPIDMDTTYSVLLTDYIYATNSNFSDLDPTPYETSIHWRQPVIDWINSLNTTPENPLDNYLDYEPRQ